MASKGEFLSETQVAQCICNFCECYLNVAPIRMIEGKLACGRCDGEGADISLIEVLLKNVELPCRFKKSGCEEVLKWDNVVQHELDCSFNHIECIVTNCSSVWRNPCGKFFIHIYEDHKQQMAIPRQKMAVNLGSNSMHNFFYVDGNRVFPISLIIGQNSFNHSVRASCSESQLRYYKYDITVQQDDLIVTWPAQKLSTWKEGGSKVNVLPQDLLESIFNKSKEVEVSVCIYIYSKAPPLNAFYDIMENIKYKCCGKRIWPHEAIYIRNNCDYCHDCYKSSSPYVLTRNGLMENLLIKLCTRPISLGDILGIKCSHCGALISNAWLKYGNSTYACDQCKDKTEHKILNTSFKTLYENLLRL